MGKKDKKSRFTERKFSVDVPDNFIIDTPGEDSEFQFIADADIDSTDEAPDVHESDSGVDSDDESSDETLTDGLQIEFSKSAPADFYRENLKARYYDVVSALTNQSFVSGSETESETVPLVSGRKSKPSYAIPSDSETEFSARPPSGKSPRQRIRSKSFSEKDSPRLKTKSKKAERRNSRHQLPPPDPSAPKKRHSDVKTFDLMYNNNGYFAKKMPDAAANARKSAQLSFSKGEISNANSMLSLRLISEPVAIKPEDASEGESDDWVIVGTSAKSGASSLSLTPKSSRPVLCSWIGEEGVDILVPKKTLMQSNGQVEKDGWNINEANVGDFSVVEENFNPYTMVCEVDV